MTLRHQSKILGRKTYLISSGLSNNCEVACIRLYEIWWVGDITKVVLEARILKLIPHAENLNNGTNKSEVED